MMANRRLAMKKKTKETLIDGPPWKCSRCGKELPAANLWANVVVDCHGKRLACADCRNVMKKYAVQSVAKDPAGFLP
jgi:hypothetical protein